jgi:hypothetical protein
MKRSVPSPIPEYLKFLSPYGPRITELALTTRALVLGEAPDASELIYDAYNAVASGYSFTGRPSDSFIHIAVYANWVNIGFNQGSQLADPEKLLQGNGRWIRHIRVSNSLDLAKPALKNFVKAAIARAERPDPKSAKSPAKAKSVVRAVYPKRRRPTSGNK